MWLNDDEALFAPWIVDCTGHAASFARRVGAKSQVADRLIGLARFGKSRARDDTRTCIEACEIGWWYSALLPQSRAIAVCLTDVETLPRSAVDRAGLWDSNFRRTRFAANLVEFPLDTPLHAFVSLSACLVPCAGPNWLAAGDAAQSHDPLSGDGILKALNSGLAAAEVVAAERPAANIGSADFDREQRKAFVKYSEERATYYAQENRWRDSPFWWRRTNARTPEAFWTSASDRGGQALAFDINVAFRDWHFSALVRGAS